MSLDDRGPARPHPGEKPPPHHATIIRIKRALGLNVILCDSCMWNWRSACHRPERPNATWCPDYTRKGSRV